MDNRTVGLRVPLGDPKNRRIENRIPGADANPYLAIAATLAAVWLGLQEKRRPTRPRKVSGEDLETLPRNLDVALDALERAKPLHKVLGEDFVTLFVEVKPGLQLLSMAMVSALNMRPVSLSAIHCSMDILTCQHA